MNFNIENISLVESTFSSISDEYYQIFVIPSELQRFVLSKDLKITKDTKVCDIKKMISAKLKFNDPKNLRYLYGPKEIRSEDDQLTLERVGIKDLATINLVVRLIGGGN